MNTVSSEETNARGTQKKLSGAGWLLVAVMMLCGGFAGGAFGHYLFIEINDAEESIKQFEQMLREKLRQHDSVKVNATGISIQAGDFVPDINFKSYEPEALMQPVISELAWRNQKIATQITKASFDEIWDRRKLAPNELTDIRKQWAIRAWWAWPAFGALILAGAILFGLIGLVLASICRLLWMFFLECIREIGAAVRGASR